MVNICLKAYKPAWLKRLIHTLCVCVCRWEMTHCESSGWAVIEGHKRLKQKSFYSNPSSTEEASLWKPCYQQGQHKGNLLKSLVRMCERKRKPWKVEEMMGEEKPWRKWFLSSSAVVTRLCTHTHWRAHAYPRLHHSLCQCFSAECYEQGLRCSNHEIKCFNCAAGSLLSSFNLCDVLDCKCCSLNEIWNKLPAAFKHVLAHNSAMVQDLELLTNQHASLLHDSMFAHICVCGKIAICIEQKCTDFLTFIVVFYTMI